MELASVILGPVVTEKAERLKASGPKHVYTIRVSPMATKIDVKNALKRFYDVDVLKVRVIHVLPKKRSLANGSEMEKRHSSKKVLVTLAEKSKALDLSSFHAHS